ncbi:putative transcription regulator protein [Oceanicola granulosus HTCC2516]|uniref:Putative transcription regulator protein n=1 Tax=Oceanicola granulosus (strain ATCC BAA-861 / DSM 15982 / KCTC 12143 / HTCC2516) TaxID=314256 RepID=Q2CFA7_OCEGH|nr:Lrp/AsnC family transcriptional regulator [Oceanicola granulosus]EAR51388.1 putative transcription regulator protein [Oceanicola granulosus HTCC2516]
MSIQTDQIDRALLDLLQREGNLSQRELAARVGLSQNACWRRLKRLEEAGALRGRRADIDAAALGLGLTVFVMIRTRHHASDWARSFRAHVEALPEVVDFHRIGGHWDYMIKAICTDMAGYDRFYQALIRGFDIEAVTGHFAMEAMLENRPLALRSVLR